MDVVQGLRHAYESQNLAGIIEQYERERKQREQAGREKEKALQNAFDNSRMGTIYRIAKRIDYFLGSVQTYLHHSLHFILIAFTLAGLGLHWWNHPYCSSKGIILSIYGVCSLSMLILARLTGRGYSGSVSYYFLDYHIYMMSSFTKVKPIIYCLIHPLYYIVDIIQFLAMAALLIAVSIYHSDSLLVAAGYIAALGFYIFLLKSATFEDFFRSFWEAYSLNVLFKKAIYTAILIVLTSYFGNWDCQQRVIKILEEYYLFLAN